MQGWSEELQEYRRIFRKFVEAEINKWGPVIKKAGVYAD